MQQPLTSSIVLEAAIRVRARSQAETAAEAAPALALNTLAMLFFALREPPTVLVSLPDAVPAAAAAAGTVTGGAAGEGAAAAPPQDPGVLLGNMTSLMGTCLKCLVQAQGPRWKHIGPTLYTAALACKGLAECAVALHEQQQQPPSAGSVAVAASRDTPGSSSSSNTVLAPWVVSGMVLAARALSGCARILRESIGSPCLADPAAAGTDPETVKHAAVELAELLRCNEGVIGVSEGEVAAVKQGEAAAVAEAVVKLLGNPCKLIGTCLLVLQWMGKQLAQLQLPGEAAAAAQALHELRQQQATVEQQLERSEQMCKDILGSSSSSSSSDDDDDDDDDDCSSVLSEGTAAKHVQLVTQLARTFGASLGQQLQEFAASLCHQLPVSSMCNNPACVRLDKLSEMQLVAGKACICAGCAASGCAARYCSKQCQTDHWKQHKPVCKRLRLASSG